MKSSVSLVTAHHGSLYSLHSAVAPDWSALDNLSLPRPFAGFVGTKQVVELPRMRVPSSSHSRARCVNYRHVIDSLRRKPGALLQCVWQQELLPNEHYRQLWQQLRAQFDPKLLA